MQFEFPQTFDSLLEVCDYFKDERICHEFLAAQIWEGGVSCPHCKNDKAYKFSDGKRYKCAKCRKIFTATVGTIFENSNLSLKKWFMAMYLVGVNKKGLTGPGLARTIKVTARTAWFMLHRIRKALSPENEGKLMNVVMMDETFVGGKNKNRHKDKKVDYTDIAREYPDKTPVLGMLQYDGYLRTFVVRNTRNTTMHPLIYENVAKGTTLVTDEWVGYEGLTKDYEVETVHHSKGRFLTDAGFTTNALEGFWSHLKRGLIGVHHKVSRKHLQRYVDEITFKYNFRHFKPGDLFKLIITRCRKRLTYKTLISV